VSYNYDKFEFSFSEMVTNKSLAGCNEHDYSSNDDNLKLPAIQLTTGRAKKMRFTRRKTNQ